MSGASHELPSGDLSENRQPEKHQQTTDYLTEPSGPVLLFRWSINNRKPGQKFFDQLDSFDKKFGELASDVKQYTINRDAQPVYAKSFLGVLEGEDSHLKAIAAVLGGMVNACGFPAVILPFVDENGEKPNIPYQFRSILPSDSKKPILEINKDVEAVALVLDVNAACEKCVYLVKGPLGMITSFQPHRMDKALMPLASVSIHKQDTHADSLESLIARLQDQSRAHGADVTVEAEHIQTALSVLLLLPKAQQETVVKLGDLIARDEILILSQEYPELVLPFLQTLTKNFTATDIPRTWSDMVDSFGRTVNTQPGYLADVAKQKVELHKDSLTARMERITENDAYLLEAETQVDAVEEEVYKQENVAALSARYALAEVSVATAQGILSGIIKARDENIQEIYFDNYDQAKALMEHAMDQIQGQVHGQMRALVGAMRNYIDQADPRLPLPVNNHQMQLLGDMIPTLQLPAGPTATEE